MGKTILGGAMAGVAATVPMTLVIGLGRAAGFLWTPPPAQITETVAERVGIEPEPESPQFQAGWLTAHFAYGAACGGIFAAVRPLLPRSNVAAGLLLGAAVWAVSYVGIMPALELFPPAKDDSPRRQQVMLAAHAIYGVATATIERELRPTDT
jgi:putative membrane protein